MMIASKLFDDGQLTSGQAAKLVGISKRTFIEVLGKYNVSIFGYDFSELEEDLDNA
jgi:predicted HTH domain antitoxin